MSAVAQRPASKADAMLQQLLDPWWRLNNLYTIVDENGVERRFVPNEEQAKFFHSLSRLNLALKARQVGLTTFLSLMALDQCLFVKNHAAAIIFHTKDDAEKAFRNKIKFAYDRLPEQIKAFCKVTKETTTEMAFANGSSIGVGVSARSGTVQWLHVCLSGDTEILTKDGRIKLIRDIEPGDMVMTGRGSYQEVKALIKNRIEDVGHPLFAVATYGYYKPLKVTGNHSVLAREHKTGRPIWKQANELAAGDYIAFPTREPSMKLRQRSLPFGDGQRIAVDRRLGWIVGMYLAEGTIHHRETIFSLHRDEVDEVCEALNEYSDYQSGLRVYHRNDSLTSTVTVKGAEFAEFLSQHFGCGEDKHIPDKVWGYGREFLDGLVFGYFYGDGCFTNPAHVQVTSIRRQLIDQMRLLLISLRFGMPSVHYRPAGMYYGRNCKATWVLKLNGAANWKFRQHFGLGLPEYTTKAAKYRIDKGLNPVGRKLWRRGADYYWSRVTSVELIEDEEFVYDIALDREPHNYVTVNGIVHNSEFGKICARFPEKAREVVTGSFNAMPKDALLFIESTAEGQSSYFYDYCMEAIRREAEGRPPSQGEFKLHFFPWWKKAAYSLDDPRITINESEQRYFDKLRNDHGIELTAEQRRWYVTKARAMGEDMKREFPSFPEEAFEAAIVGAIYASQMSAARGDGRVTHVPYDPAVPVNTFWDLGVNDTTAIWLHQRVATQNRFIGFYQASNEGLHHFAKWLQERGYVFGTHYLPHDARARMQGERPETREDILRRLLPGQRITVVRRIDDITTGIDLTRQALASCWFDQKACAEGLRMLDSYQYAWDETRGTFTRTPLHNFASNGADAFRQFAQAFIQTSEKGGKKFKRHRAHWRA